MILLFNSAIPIFQLTSIQNLVPPPPKKTTTRTIDWIFKNIHFFQSRQSKNGQHMQSKEKQGNWGIWVLKAASDKVESHWGYIRGARFPHPSILSTGLLGRISSGSTFHSRELQSKEKMHLLKFSHLPSGGRRDFHGQCGSGIRRRKEGFWRAKPERSMRLRNGVNKAAPWIRGVSGSSLIFHPQRPFTG